MMKMTPVNIKDIKPIKKRTAKSIFLLEEFLASGCDAVQLHWKKQGCKNKESVAVYLRKAIRQNSFDISVVTRGENVYLVRKEKTGEVPCERA